jgi:hypothetical protein
MRIVVTGRSRTPLRASVLALLLPLLASSCAGERNATNRTETRSMSSDPKAEQLTNELAKTALAGLPESEARPARQELSAMAADWLREAGSDADAPAILDLLRREFTEQLAGKSAEQRRDVVRSASLERRVRRLSAQSYALGQKIIEKKISAEEARREGEALMAATDALAPPWQAIVDENAKANLHRQIQDVRMEALYAVERKAMSARLSRYAADHGDKQDDAPKILGP